MTESKIDRTDYHTPNGMAGWWCKDGAWHIATPEKSTVTGRMELLWQPGLYNSRESAIAALRAKLATLGFATP